MILYFAVTKEMLKEQGADLDGPFPQGAYYPYKIKNTSTLTTASFKKENVILEALGKNNNFIICKVKLEDYSLIDTINDIVSDLEVKEIEVMLLEISVFVVEKKTIVKGAYNEHHN